MKADSSAGKEVLFNGDSWRFSHVAKQAKCDWEQFNTMTCDVDPNVGLMLPNV